MRGILLHQCMILETAPQGAVSLRERSGRGLEPTLTSMIAPTDRSRPRRPF